VQILLAESDLPIDRLTEAPQNHLFIAFLRPIFQRRYYTALREAVRKGHLEVVRLLSKAGAQMTYPTEIYSPFLFSFRNRIPMEILECFLANNVQLNLICGGSLCQVPDAVLATLGSENRKQLLALLRCGLKPSLMEWCTCRNPSGYSLLDEVRHLSYIGNLQELLHILAVFSPSVPSCCDAVAKCLNVPSQRVFRLEHLCRCAIRQYTPPSKLLDDSWMTEIGLPNKMISFVRCDPVPSGLSDLMALNDNGVE